MVIFIDRDRPIKLSAYGITFKGKKKKNKSGNLCCIKVHIKEGGAIIILYYLLTFHTYIQKYLDFFTIILHEAEGFWADLLNDLMSLKVNRSADFHTK